MNLTVSINDRLETVKKIFDALNRMDNSSNFLAKEYDCCAVRGENVLRNGEWSEKAPALSTAIKYGIVAKTGEKKVVSTYTDYNCECRYVIFDDGKRISESKFHSLGDFKEDIANAHGGILETRKMPIERKMTNRTFQYGKRYNNYAEYLRIEVLPELRATYEELEKEAGL